MHLNGLGREVVCLYVSYTRIAAWKVFDQAAASVKKRMLGSCSASDWERMCLFHFLHGRLMCMDTVWVVRCLEEGGDKG